VELVSGVLELALESDLALVLELGLVPEVLEVVVRV